jgi:hypothetical protein
MRERLQESDEDEARVSEQLMVMVRLLDFDIRV